MVGRRRAKKTARQQAAARARMAVAGPVAAEVSSEAFHAFREAQRAAAGKPIRTKPAERPIKPTDERLEKNDKPRKTQTGFYRAPPPIERLRDQGKLDPTPHVNEAMFQASVKLYGHFFEAGLHGIKAQDVSSIVGGGAGDGGACQFPRNERAYHHRERFREACRVMGWPIGIPHRGAARLTVDVVCFEVTVSDAAQIHIPGGRTEVIVAAGMDRLREGLFSLAAHWSLI